MNFVRLFTHAASLCSPCFSRAGRAVFLMLVLGSVSGCSVLSGVLDSSIEPQVPVIVKRNAVAAPVEATKLSAKKSDSLPKVSVVVNREVQREITELQENNRRGVKAALENGKEHFPTISQIFEDEGIPKELVNVAFVESGFNEQARSPRGAIGMWQFMKSTAQYYGLKIHVKEDQRKDIILSSLAAARHLRDLYVTFSDWYLALAAYNAGRGGVEKAMERGGTRDFWELARRGLLPKETARFVPKILAASLIMKDPEAFGFESVG